jgi:hypothetical protein
MTRQLPIEALRRLVRQRDSVAVVSSRLGHDFALHRQICRFLNHSLLDCRARGATLLVACGTAIEPWAVRAAELFQVSILRLAIGKRDPRADYFVSSNAPALSRDQLVIELADRVDAVHTRPGGKIEQALLARIARRQDGSTRVAVTGMRPADLDRLIAQGAIGWFIADAAKPSITADRPPLLRDDDAWTRTTGDWLIHCTRAPNGRWPEETERQYRDAVLIGGPHATGSRGPLETLVRIIASGRLIAGSVATRQQHPVVCFSAVALTDLLDRRCFRPHLGRWDYEPYGVAIRLATAKAVGVQPVIYGTPSDRRCLASEAQYRFHPIGKTYDWRAEQEWRARESIDLRQLPAGAVRIFAAPTIESRARLAHSLWPVTFITQTTTESL